MIRIPLLFFLLLATGSATAQDTSTIWRDRCGIGAVVGEDNGAPVIHDLLPNNAAIQEGLKANDKIIQIDDKKVEGLNLKQVVELIRGPAGTVVKIVVTRGGVSSPITFSITREPVQIPVNQTAPRPTSTSPAMPPSGQ
jgi:C-terminal processing protease CtpA/Prc